MVEGLEDLDALIAQVRTLDGFVAGVAPKCARVCETIVAKQIDRGEDPEGNPWQLTKDGRVPLRFAAQALRSFAQGATVYVSLTGIETRHHFGAVKGGVKRAILPKEATPEMVKTMSELITREWDKTKV